MITPEQHAEVRRLYYAEHCASAPSPRSSASIMRRSPPPSIARACSRAAGGAVDGARSVSAVPAGHRAQYPRLRATRLHEMVRLRGYPRSAVQVRRAVRRLRPAPPSEAYLRLTTLPGEVAQVDWGSFGADPHRARDAPALRLRARARLLAGAARRLHARPDTREFPGGHVEAVDAWADAPAS